MLRQVHSGRLQAIKIDDGFRYASSSIETRPDIRPADPTDPHPLARTSCALGAMADLIRDSRDHGPAVLPNDGEAAGAAVHILSLAAVAARHTIAYSSLDDVARPVAVGRYAERAIDGLRDLAVQPVSLHHLASVHPEPAPASLNDRLEAALHAWQASARHEIDRLIPSVDVLRQIANQGAHLCAVRASLGDVSEEQANHLRDSAHALAQGENAWGSLTTLSRPSHEFVTASRELFETLASVEKAGQPPHPRRSTREGRPRPGTRRRQRLDGTHPITPRAATDSQRPTRPSNIAGTNGRPTARPSPWAIRAGTTRRRRRARDCLGARNQIPVRPPLPSDPGPLGPDHPVGIRLTSAKWQLANLSTTSMPPRWGRQDSAAYRPEGHVRTGHAAQMKGLLAKATASR